MNNFMVFDFFIEVISYLFCEVFSRKASGSNKSILRKIVSAILFLLFVSIFILIVVAIIFVVMYILKFSTNIFVVVSTILLLSAVVVGVSILLLILSEHLLEFESIEDEMTFSKHKVIAVLQETKKDCFVLADFNSYAGIYPSVYKMHGLRYGLLDLYSKSTWYRKIFLESNDIKIQRIKTNQQKHK